MLKFIDGIFKFVYFVFSVSTLWIFTVVCGLFFFTFIPATIAVMELSDIFVKDKFNYAESIIKKYFVIFGMNFKKSFKLSFFPLLLVILLINIFIVKNFNIIHFQLLFITIYYYLLIFFVTYLMYLGMYLSKKSINMKADILNALILMCSNFFRMAASLLLTAVYIFFFYGFTLFAVIFGTGIFSYIFTVINHKQLENLLKEKKRKR